MTHNRPNPDPNAQSPELHHRRSVSTAQHHVTSSPQHHITSPPRHHITSPPHHHITSPPHHLIPSSPHLAKSQGARDGSWSIAGGEAVYFNVNVRVAVSWVCDIVNLRVISSQDEVRLQAFPCLLTSVVFSEGLHDEVPYNLTNRR